MMNMTNPFDPHAYLARESMDVAGQPLTGEALAQVIRAYDIYARLIGPEASDIEDNVVGFDVYFIMVFTEVIDLVNEWEWSGAEFEEHFESGCELRNVLLLKTPDGFAALYGESVPEALRALAVDPAYTEVQFLESMVAQPTTRP